MKLYTKPGACSTASHIALKWAGIPFDVEIVKDLNSEEYLKINPAGTVPFIEDDGWTLSQNVAIMQYISDNAPDAALEGDGSARQRAEANRWLAFVNSDVHPTFKPMFGGVSYLPDESKALAKEHAKATLRGMFERANEQLKDHDYIAGFRSYADPYWFIVTRWAKAVRVDLTGFDALEAFYARMEADAGVQEALKAEGLS